MSDQTNKTKKKIAVLGAGLGGLSAAYELTDYPGWNDLYDVTVYQSGWQLGGKCRTGRGEKERIEEHGIHVFLGFYNNAIRMVRLAYEELQKNDGIKADTQFKTWESLFYKQFSIQLPQYSVNKDKWEQYGLVLPGNDLIPGIGEAPTEQENMKKMLLLGLELLLGSPYQPKGKGCFNWIARNIMRWIWPKSKNVTDFVPKFTRAEHEHPAWWPELDKQVRQTHGNSGHPIHVQYLHHAKQLVTELPNNHEHAAALHATLAGGPHTHEKIAHLLFAYISAVEKLIAPFVGKDSRMEMFWLFVQLGYYNYLGLNQIYDPKTGTYDYDSINDLDYREWLIKIGAPQNVAWSAPVKDIYTLVFAYPQGGDSSLPGSIAAGTALLGAMLILLGYKGAVMWRFRGGTADVVVSPVYEVLKARGVQFKFFHEVEKIDYAEGDEIETITIGEQIRLKNPEREFHPTKRIKGLECWASHPFWRWKELADQIHPDDLAALQKNDINLNSAWSGWENRKVQVLKKGVDFDQVVLAISIAALKDICNDIIENKTVDKRKIWKEMVDNVQTVQTQGVQLWIKKDLKELGMDLAALGLKETNLPIFDTYANPINSYADMTDLTEWEVWDGKDKPKHLAYFCGPLSENGPIAPYQDTSFPSRQYERVKEMTTQWLFDNASFLWPKATTLENPTGFDLDLLCDPDDRNPAKSGLEKLNRQFFIANIDPSERYVLSLPGSGKYRLKTDQGGYKNLFLAGDWIDTGYNMGCAEVAVMSGLMAAQALRGNVYGLHHHKPIIKDLKLPK